MTEFDSQLEMQIWPSLGNSSIVLTLTKYFPGHFTSVVLVYSLQLALQPQVTSINCPSLINGPRKAEFPSMRSQSMLQFQLIRTHTFLIQI